MSLNQHNFASVPTAVEVTNFPEPSEIATEVNATIVNDLVNVNVSNAYFDVYVKDDQVNVNVINSEMDVHVTNESLHVVNQKLDSIQYDGFNNMNMNLNNLNPNFIDVANGNGLKVAVQNASIPITNGALSSMSFNLSKLNVLDYDSNQKLENIYNVENTKSSTTLWVSPILAGGFTNVLNLNQKKVNNITFLGTQDSAGNVLTVQFSNNNIGWYDSQYSYSFGSNVSGNFGFNIQCCPQFVRVKSANACYLLLEVSFC